MFVAAEVRKIPPWDLLEKEHDPSILQWVKSVKYILSTRIYVHANAWIFRPLLKNVFNIEIYEDLVG